MLFEPGKYYVLEEMQRGNRVWIGTVFRCVKRLTSKYFEFRIAFTPDSRNLNGSWSDEPGDTYRELPDEEVAIWKMSVK